MEFDLKDISNELIIINKITIEKLFNQKNLNGLILYIFYYKTAKWQKTNQIKANDTYTKKCLHWGSDKLKNAKDLLKQMRLIDIIQKRNDKSQIDGWYIKINYYSTTLETTTPIIPDVGQQETNAYNNNNNKCLNNNINTIGNICNSKKFKKPTLTDIENYINEKDYNMSAESFYDFYESNGWKVGKNPMKDWKAAVRNWNRNETNKKPKYNNGTFKVDRSRIVNP